MPHRKKRGFTLIELLVVVAVITILISLLMPAVQQAREAARRTHCQNNLKQIGIALHNYHDLHNVLPPGYVAYGDYDSITTLPSDDFDAVTWDATPGWAWGTMLLPFLDQFPLYDELDLESPAWAPQNIPLLARQVNTLLCPSSIGEVGEFVVVDDAENPLIKGGSEIRLGRSHYVASHGQEECWGTCSGPSGTLDGDVSRIADGPFYRNSKTKFSSVIDGLSTTVFFGEHTSWLSDKTWAAVIPGATVHPKINSPDNAAESAATLVLVHTGPAAGEMDALGNPIIHPPNFPTIHVGQMQSDHPGGAYVLFGDGSVRFISETVDQTTFSAMTSIAEREVIGAN